VGNRWNRGQIEAFQTRRLRALVQHAYRRVPYYRQLFDQAGLLPDDIRTLQDLTSIPLTSRSDLQRLPNREIIARGFHSDRLVVHRTSGSSGEPLSIRRSELEDRLLQAYRLRALFRLGLQIAHRRAAVVTPRLTELPLYMKSGVLRYEEVHCLWPPERILSRLREIRPDVLRGYPGTLSWLAQYLTDADREQIQPRFITTDSEVMTSDMRDRIRAGFQSEVFDFYDSHEFNMIAWECPQSGIYHVSDASVLVEVVRDGRPVGSNEEGELVGTALHSWAMPFIRFRLGDVVTRGPDVCPCGAPNSTIASIQGRVADRFQLPDGRSVHPYTLVNTIVTGSRWVRRYQIVQEQLGLIAVKLVPLAGETPEPASVAAIRQSLRERLGEGVLVKVELMKEIPASANGKFRPYFSLVTLSDPPTPAVFREVVGTE
jgi:phenylacetate-CoA ligase